MGAIILFFLGFAIFCLTIPIRSTIILLKMNIKLTESKAFTKTVGGMIRLGEKVTSADKSLNRTKYVKGAMSSAEFALCQAQRLLVVSLTALVHLLQWVATLLTGVSVLVLSVILLFVAILVASAGGILILVLDGNFSFGSGSGLQDTSGKDCVSKQQEFISACEKVWLDWRAKEYNYSQAVKSDPDYTSVRTDCSGFVYCVMQEMGYVPKDNPGTIFYTGNMHTFFASTVPELEEIKYTAGMQLEPGDILVCRGKPTGSGNDGHTNVHVGDGLYWDNGKRGRIPDNDKPFDASWFLQKMSGRDDTFVYRWKKSDCKEKKKSDGTNQEIWIETILKTQKIIAEQNFEYSHPSNPYYRFVEKLGTYFRPDCSGVVYGCAQQYGAYELYPNGNPATIFGTGFQVSSMTSTGFFEIADVKSEAELQPGDVVVGSGHTQIFMGDGLWVNGGNTDDLRAPDPVQSSYFPAGCTVVRPKEGVEVNPRL